MTQINATIFSDAEGWLVENLPDMSVDGTSCVYPTHNWIFDGRTKMVDSYEGKTKMVDMLDLVTALQKLAELIDAKKLFVGCLKSATELVDPCNWDVEVVDAFYQLAFYGEVIYG